MYVAFGMGALCNDVQKAFSGLQREEKGREGEEERERERKLDLFLSRIKNPFNI